MSTTGSPFNESSSLEALTPCTDLSIAALKKEMSEKYNITNFDDCIEKSDLVMKLTSLRSTNSSTTTTSTVVYPPDITHISSNGGEKISYQRIKDIDLVGNTINPSALITLMHGLGDNALGWKSAASQFSQYLGGKALFMIPTAPVQRVSINMGSRGTAWYDIGINVNTKEDTSGVMASARYVQQAALYYANKYRIPTNKIVFGGFSQGGAVSIASGMSAVVPAVSGAGGGFVPAGILCLSGYFAASEGVKLAAGINTASLPAALSPSESSAGAHKCEVMFCHGESDPIVTYDIAKKSFNALEQIKRDTQWGSRFFGDMVFKSYPGMMHSTSPEEITEIIRWLKRVLSL